MFQDAFEKLEIEEVEKILTQIQGDLDNVAFEWMDTTILACNLPYYPGYRVLEISDHTVAPAIKRCVVYSPDDWVVLDYTNAPIYTLNEKLPIRLNNENISEYVRFFFTYVRGKRGKFEIVEGVDDINWKEDPPAPARKAISTMITPITLVPPTKGQDEGKFYCTACMMFKNALFKSEIIIDTKGYVTLENEELQIDDMPVIDDAIGQ